MSKIIKSAKKKIINIVDKVVDVVPDAPTGPTPEEIAADKAAAADAAAAEKAAADKAAADRAAAEKAELGRVNAANADSAAGASAETTSVGNAEAVANKKKGRKPLIKTAPKGVLGDPVVYKPTLLG